jgi:hypothetical protein
MTLMEAAKKWGLSPNWVRELVKSGRVRSTLRDDVPVPYYEIPNDEVPPPRRFQRTAASGRAKAVVAKAAKAKAPVKKKATTKATRGK